jgi:hypothetical protein
MRYFTALFLGGALLGLAGCGKAPPSDKDLADAFFAKRATFEALRSDLCKLRYDQTINRDPPWAQPQMPAAEEQRYRATLTMLGAKGVKYVRGCQLWIEMWSSGVGRNTAYKKYRYGPPMYRIIEVKTADAPPVKDLNDYLDKRVAIASFEKNLDGDWWIELDHWR